MTEPTPQTTSGRLIPERTHCEHCLTGEGPHFERWEWTLLLDDKGGATVQLARDGIAKLAIPLTPEQVTQLMGDPVTMAGVLHDGL